MQLLILALFLPQILFSQTFQENPHFEPYIGDGNVGMQINSVLTGLKSSVTNQETDLNIGLFYQDMYAITDEQVLGVLNGRLITEFPLSSFDILADIKHNKQMSLSNFASQNPQFQDAYNKYMDFLNLVNGNAPSENYYYDDEYYGNEEYYETEEYATEEVSEEVDDTYFENDEYGGYYEEKVIEQNPSEKEALDKVISGYFTKKASMFARKKQSFLAQQVSNTNSVTTNLKVFDADEFVLRNLNSKLISQEDLSFLVHYEEIKKSYQNLLKEYHLYLSNQQTLTNRRFDPGDPNEHFTLMLIGDTTKHHWSSRFSLNGKNNYQSYDDIVWYLGFEVPLRKRDIASLYNLFSKNKKVLYYIKGASGTVEFSLNPHFIKAMHELLEFYARGAFINNSKTDFPILQ